MSKAPTILLIEDNPNNARIMSRVLEKHAYTILHAEDGETGLGMALAEHPDLILLDLGLPDVDGQTVAAWLKQNETLRHVPLVVVTAWPSETAGQMVAAYGCQGYIAKPIDTRRFPNQIAAFLTST
ncbi:MAG: response regulator [Anaerolineae bacterium]|nr:response regulator [Anaerolineae bacterium]